MSENTNLYVNVSELLDLIECMQMKSSYIKEVKAYEEVINTILDLKWKEIKY